MDHVCIAVRALAASATRLCDVLGYRPRTDVDTNTRQKVNVQFLQREGSPDIKLIEPSADDSPLWGFLRSKGEGLHHLCFRTQDLERELHELADRGLRITARPEPGEAFDGHLIAFGYAGCGVNLEFIDTDARRGLLLASNQRG